LTTANGYNLKAAVNIDDAEDGVGFADASASVDQVGKTGLVTYDTEDAFYITNAEGTSSNSFTLAMDKEFDNGLDVFASYTNTEAESGWIATSSQLSSNLENMVAVDRMNVDVGNTPWAIKHRLVAGLNYTANWFNNAPTKFSLFYKVYSGKRFTYTLDGFDDGYSEYNTRMYVPTAGDPNVVYEGVTEGEVLTAVHGIGTPGSHVDAHTGQLPYTRGLDLRIAQEIPVNNSYFGIKDHKLVLYYDLLNVLNFINEDKGHVYFQGYSTRGLLESAGLDSEGRIRITGVDTRKGTLDSYASRYRMQLGFTYKF
jgi:hypothetical protein